MDMAGLLLLAAAIGQMPPSVPTEAEAVAPAMRTQASTGALVRIVMMERVSFAPITTEPDRQGQTRTDVPLLVRYRNTSHARILIEFP